MKRTHENHSAKKVLRVLLPIVVLALVAFGVYGFFSRNYLEMFIFLACAVLLSSGEAIRLRTVRAHYDPKVHDGKYKSGADMQHRPDDVPLNLWDQISEKQTDHS